MFQQHVHLYPCSLVDWPRHAYAAVMCQALPLQWCLPTDTLELKICVSWIAETKMALAIHTLSDYLQGYASGIWEGLLRTVSLHWKADHCYQIKAIGCSMYSNKYYESPVCTFFHGLIKLLQTCLVFAYQIERVQSQSMILIRILSMSSLSRECCQVHNVQVASQSPGNSQWQQCSTWTLQKVCLTT